MSYKYMIVTLHEDKTLLGRPLKQLLVEDGFKS